MSNEGTRGDRMLLGRMIAAVEMIGHTGALECELAYEEDCGEPESVMWYATGLYQGTKVWSRHYPYPAQAAEDLLARLLNGGQCAKCQRTTVVGLIVLGLCCFSLAATDIDEPNTYRYVRSCEVES